MAQSSFGSAFDSFTTNPKMQTESEEPEERVDAFDDDGYDEDNEGDAEYEEDEGYEDTDNDDEIEEPEDSDGDDSYKKRFEDSQKYISEMKSKIDRMQNAFEQTQQQLNYLTSNQQNQQAEEDTLDLDVDYEPDEYGSFEDFEKKKSKKELLDKVKKEAKEGRDLKTYHSQRQQSELNYVTGQPDYEQINQTYQDLQKTGEDAQILNHLNGQPLALYYFLKNKQASKQLDVKKDKIKERAKIPRTSGGKTGSGKRRGSQKDDTEGLFGSLSSNLKTQIKASSGLPKFQTK